EASAAMVAAPAEAVGNHPLGAGLLHLRARGRDASIRARCDWKRTGAVRLRLRTLGLRVSRVGPPHSGDSRPGRTAPAARPRGERAQVVRPSGRRPAECVGYVWEGAGDGLALATTA